MLKKMTRILSEIKKFAGLPTACNSKQVYIMLISSSKLQKLAEKRIKEKPEIQISRKTRQHLFELSEIKPIKRNEKTASQK